MEKMGNMRKEILINEIIKLCLDYGVIINIDKTKIIIEKNLDEIAFIEKLYNVIRTKVKDGEFTDFYRVKELLIELAIISIELEFRCYNSVLRDKGNKAEGSKLIKKLDSNTA